MNAKEFIKQYGWEISTRLQREMLGITEQVADSVAVWGQSEWDKLKQLVDAWELTNRVGNMVECKRLLSMLEKSNIPHMTISGEFNGRKIEQKVLTIDFKKAIELVESVNG